MGIGIYNRKCLSYGLSRSERISNVGIVSISNSIKGTNVAVAINFNAYVKPSFTYGQEFKRHLHNIRAYDVVINSRVCAATA